MTKRKQASNVIDELLKSYKDNEARLKICFEKKKHMHDELLKLERRLLESGNNHELKKKRDEVRDKFFDLQFREEALQSLLGETKQRIIEEIPFELRENLESIEKELESVHKEEAKKKVELAEAMAVVGGIYEELRGQTFLQRPSGELKPVYPRIEINGLSPLHGEIQGKYFQEVDRLRKKHKMTIRSRLDQLTKERIRILGLLEKDPKELANRLLEIIRNNEPQKEEVKTQKWWHVSGKVPWKYSEPLKPEYRDTFPPKRDFKVAKMYPND